MLFSAYIIVLLKLVLYLKTSSCCHYKPPSVKSFATEKKENESANGTAPIHFCKQNCSIVNRQLAEVIRKIKFNQTMSETIMDEIVKVATNEGNFSIITNFDNSAQVKIINHRFEKDFPNHEDKVCAKHVSATVHLNVSERHSMSEVQVAFVMVEEKYTPPNMTAVFFIRTSTLQEESVVDLKLTTNNNVSKTFASSQGKSLKENFTRIQCVTSEGKDRFHGGNCRYVKVLGQEICRCKLSKFAGYSMIVSYQLLPTAVELGIASLAGCILSIIGLFFTILIYNYFGELRSRQGTVYVTNISLCVLVVDIIFIAGIGQVETIYVCYVITALLHYFLLVTWFWMTANAYNMYQAFVKMMIPSTTIWRVSAATAYTVPLLIVTTNVILAFQTDLKFNTPDTNLFESVYKAHNMCWLHGYSLYFGFLTPVGILLIANLYMFAVVITRITCGRNHQVLTRNQAPAILRDVRIAFMLITNTGLTWLFGFAMLISDDQLWQTILGWIFSLSVTLQGFAMFLFHCVTHPTARNLWIGKIRSLLRCQGVGRRLRKKSCYRVNNSSVAVDNRKEQIVSLSIK